jgi:two-component system response regulator YesN
MNLMYSVLLVDDEKLELDTLQYYFRTESINIHIAGTAKNGQDALIKIEQLKPDIILTDVRMPIMDGLELAKQVRERYPQIKLVFLSGFDEFAYIKAALMLEAVGYLLKPVDPIELQTVMNKVIAKFEAEQINATSAIALQENLLKKLLIESQEENQSKLIQQMNQIQPGFNESKWGFGLVSIDDYRLQLNETHDNESEQKSFALLRELKDLIGVGHVFLMKEGYYGILLPASALVNVSQLDEHYVLEKLEMSFNTIHEKLGIALNFPVTLGFSNRLSEAAKLHLLFHEANLAIESRFYKGSGHLITYFKEDKVETDTAISLDNQAVFENLLLLHIDKVEMRLHSFLEHATTIKMKKEHLIQLLTGLIDTIWVQLHKHQPDILAEIGSKNEAWRLLHQLDTISSFQMHLSRLFREIDHYLRIKLLTDKNARLVSQVISILEVQYGEAWTVEDLAKKVFLSPSYLSGLFKERTGQTLIEYTTKIRMEKAAELLHDPSLKVHEIARQVGYESTSYFCSIFQKHNSVSPNDFRKRRLRESL